ncbi:MAG TPA: NYN domain-containing protein [Candidatus Omnitrophota bacterium]|nr:NYN domain-containing protein [Candidatus Omnitrophota bacterium]
MKEPIVKRAFVFVDGQNLFYAAREAFGYYWPNYDIKKLSEQICASKGWELASVYFYTGVPDLQDNSLWHNFWSKKLSYMGRIGIKIFSRPLRYHNKEWRCPACSRSYSSLIGHEKGVDVRMALDIIRFAHEKVYDVAIIFSQDQDLSEVSEEVRRIAVEQNRWIKVASVFPVSPTKKDARGINKTDWVKVERQVYDACLDPGNYKGTA